MNSAKPTLLSLMLVMYCAAVQADQWMTLEPADRPITVSASGIVSSANSQRFGPPPSRNWRVTITQLAAEGSKLTEGDVIAKFDASSTDDRVRNLTGELNAKRSELESTLEIQAQQIEEEKVQLASARSAADKAERKANVSADLYASLEYRKLVEERRSAKDLYERQQQRLALTERVREAQIAELKADVRRLESELVGAQRELESFTIRAPQTGVVIVGTNNEGQKLDVNDAVNPGMIVAELADSENLLIQAEVPEFAAASIAVGQVAAVTIDAAGGNELEAKVTEVASIVRRQSRYSQAMVRDVTLSLPADSMARLRPGMSAKIVIKTDVRSGALAIPDLALRYRDGQPGVEIRGRGWSPVTLGPASGGLRIVDAGVEAGAEVAL
ncbi:MAG: efflux RND transporter periplasmic adaptor subunit [Pseudomonadota bacterium]